MSYHDQVGSAAQRNRSAILEVLEKVLPPVGTVLEIASGTGRHAVFLAPALAPRLWQPSDMDPEYRTLFEAERARAPAPNLLPPLHLDAAAPRWPVEDAPPTPPIAAIICINMIHIAPWEAGLGLLAGAGRILPPGGVLYLYGPYRRGGVHTAPSNEAFDKSLQSRNPQWGVRDLDDVAAAAAGQGLALEQVIEMPVNNLSVVFHRQA